MFFFYFRRSLFTREKVEISKYDTRRRGGVEAVIIRSICLILNQSGLTVLKKEHYNEQSKTTITKLYER